jgi:hypothetical protein
MFVQYSQLQGKAILINTPKKPMKGLKVVPVEYLYQALQYMSENT